jgi:leucyl aminopeptidase
MEFIFATAFEPKTSILILPFFQDVSLSKSGPKPLADFLKKREENQDFKAEEGELLLGLPDGDDLPKKVVLWGMGQKKNFSAKKVRELSAQMLKAVRKMKNSGITLWCPDSFLPHAQALGEGLAFGNYNLGKFKTGQGREELEQQTVKKISVVTSKKTQKFETELAKGAMIAEAVGSVRDLVNAGPSFKTVDYLAAKAQAIARENGYGIKVLSKDELKKMGMGGIVGVNRGSELGAKMVVLDYAPKALSKNPPVVIIGKGIIFDSGGYNLKPGGSLFEMQMDMAGAGAVMGIFMLLKKLGIKQRVVGIFPLTDNLLNASSQKPSDVVTTYSGKTVEIMNTDAEGRMILCDAITYALKHFQPRCVVDIATLTGACMVALGNRYAGLFGNDAGLIEKIRRAGETADELAWPMPIHPDHSAQLKSKIADLRNWDEVPHAGASKGAAFLKEFAGECKWAHIDIAGTAFVKDPKKYESPMGTGFGVRLMIEFLEKLR